MALHYMTLKAAVSKYNTVPVDQLEAALQADEKKFTAEDIAEIIAEINNTPQQIQQPIKNDEQKAKVLDLTKFDYSKLDSKSLIELFELMATLNDNTKYPFAEYRVEILRGERFEGMKDSPVDIIGIRLKDSKPIKETFSTWKTIKSLNGANILTTRTGQKYITDGQFAQASGRPGEGRIYLPKK